MTDDLDHVIALATRPLVVSQPPTAGRDHNSRRPASPTLTTTVTIAVLLHQLLSLLLDQRNDLNPARVQSRGISPGLAIRQLDLGDGAIAWNSRLLAGALAESSEGGSARRARRLCTIVATAAAEEAGEEAADEGFQSGQRGADDAYVHLDGRPVGRGPVVVGCVFGDGDYVDGV